MASDRRGIQWLAAEPRDVVELAAVGGRAGAPAGPAGRFDAGLAFWQRRVQRRWLGVLLRRHAVLAAAAAVLLEALALAGLLPGLLVLLLPLALLAIGVAIACRRQPSLAEIARLLDERLGLHDRLGTALEIERRADGTEVTALERRASADAAAVLGRGSDRWRVSAVPGRGEWGALAGALAALAILVVVGASAGTGSGSGSASGGGAIARSGSPGKPGEPGEASSARPAARAHGTSPSRQGAAAAEPRRQGAATSGYRRLPRAPRGARGVGGPSSPAGAGAARARGVSGPESGRPSQGSAAGEPPGRGAAAAAHGAAGKGLPAAGRSPHAASNGSAAARAAGAAGARAGAAGKPASAGAHPARSAAAAGHAGTPGAPAGSPTAGGQAGTTGSAPSKPIAGRTSQDLRLQSGYAPIRSGRGEAASGRGKGQGGGGRGRSARVEGGGTGRGAFAYVPATGGAVATDPGLLRNYFRSLKWIEGLPW